MDTPNYKESTISGTQYQRAVRIQIDNPLGGAPSIMFCEEEVLVMGDKSIKNLCANLNVAFDLENPLHIQAYTVLNAIYEEERGKRDALLQEPPAGD